MTRELVDVSAEVDHLYQVPLAEFVAARNALASRLARGGNKAAALQVKQLAKPSLAAWIVNQLYWQARPEFDGLIAAGDRLREAQQQRLAGSKTADLHEAMRARQQAVDALLARADALAQSSRAAITPAIRQRAATTLDALAVHGGEGERPPAGRLTTELQPSGFAALASLTFGAPFQVATEQGAPPKAGRTRPPSRAQNGGKRQAALRAEARATVKAAEADMASRRRAVSDAERAETRARQRAAAADQKVRDCHTAIAEARRTLDAALEQASEATDALGAARTTAAEATKTFREAEWRLRQARAALDRVGKSTT
ncbi:MAG: hypothetical protein GEV06_00465 [Luteitalea sp.]|nr:hypothetical protein [Luteitalea sp.]